MTHTLHDHGDGTGEYRGWKLKKERHDDGREIWHAEPPYELHDRGREIWEAAGGRWKSRLRRFVDGGTPSGGPCPRTPFIESTIDLFEAARERLMAAAFAHDGPDDSDRLVRIER